MEESLTLPPFLSPSLLLPSLPLSLPLPPPSLPPSSSTALSLLSSQSWHDHVNIQKALLPGLWSLMAAGGHGCARIAYPCLLPLVSKLTEAVFVGDAQFAKNYMERLMSGLVSQYTYMYMYKLYMHMSIHVDTVCRHCRILNGTCGS